ncbi:MAG: YgiQ family radical SAM protein [Verrucomicrobiae bacterium]|nr:YgiQ family radical SAM protein [Verrucomicrobiae bacterium]
MFLPTTPEEIRRLGWDALDVILVSGDSYIDSPHIGAALIGKTLLKAGFRVGIIAQPDGSTAADITRLGEPRLFWGVTAGSVDSMVANYTATGKRRRTDDYTPGGINNRRPDRACIAYTNWIRRYTKTTRPIVLGGIEASLRRIAHYDFWDNTVRRSILFDAKADFLLYGMAERTVVALAKALHAETDPRQLPGLCYLAKQKPPTHLALPSYEEVRADKHAFIQMFQTFYEHTDPVRAKGLCQQHGERWLVQNPPPPYETQQELDEIYNLDFEREQHPFYQRHGAVKALETIRFSITTHRGCYGECNFCAIAVHEGRAVRWRSINSVLQEARQIIRHPRFKGYITDLGGPTANMYGIECAEKSTRGACRNKRCLYPQICPKLSVNHGPLLELMRRVRELPGIKKVCVGSGIRHDLVLADACCGDRYLAELVAHHVSGQLKIAPEHVVPHVLAKMGKPGVQALLNFKRKFEQATHAARRPQFLTYYLLAAHPGCTDKDMHVLKRFTTRTLKLRPEQVQVFTPTPSTYSTLMFYTETDPFTGQAIYVEKNPKRRERQKLLLTGLGSAAPKAPHRSATSDGTTAQR